jgi:hypothetical protein
LNVKKLFAKAYPVLSLVKTDTNNNEITIKIANPSDSDEDLTISGFIFNASGNVNTISLNDQDISDGWVSSTGLNIQDGKRITLAAGESTELRFQAKGDSTHSNTAQLK